MLVTIDYSALSDADYRYQVLQNLRPTLSLSRPFSFRHQLADAWYDLHNPDQTGKPMTVAFNTRREDFSPNLSNLKIQHVELFFGRADGSTFEVPVTRLAFEVSGAEPVGGGGVTIDGAISTRTGNGRAWVVFQDKSPVGIWELVLPNTSEVRGRFAEKEITDVLFVLTYSGRTAEWPA